MRISRFDYDCHYQTMAMWYMKHGLDIPSMKSLPDVGFVASEDRPVAIGFLYRTDSNVVLFDGFVTDPLASREHRDKALNLIADYLLEETGPNCEIVVLTKTQSIVDRALKFGFNDNGQYRLLTRGVENGFSGGKKHISS